MKKIWLLLFTQALMANEFCSIRNQEKNENNIKENVKAIPFKYTLPLLPYAFNSLEPYIDAKTMEIHYTKHHQKYVDDLNKVLENHPTLLGKPVEYLLKNLKEIPESIKTQVIDFAGGHLNHSMFWLMMTPNAKKQPEGIIKKAIIEQFGTVNKFKELFSKCAKELFGSGWTWLCVNANKKLTVITTKDQDSPISLGLKPILGLDVWEHAYYLKYQNRRIDYIDSWWNIVNWDYVEKQYQLAIA